MRPGALLLLAALGCPDKPAPPTGLRVPLPEGWVATARGAGLSVGPRGRVVATLEPLGGEVPRPATLARAVTAEGASDVLEDEGTGYAAVRYTLGAGRDGFLAVKRLGSRTVWCASTADATEGDVENGLALCRNLGADAPVP